MFPRRPSSGQTPLPEPETHTILVDGRERRFLFYPAPAGTVNPPVVMLLHGGGGGTAENTANSTRLPQAAQEAGFCCVVPNSYTSSWNYGDTLPRWLRGTETIDDVKFLDEVFNYARGRGADMARAYLTGVSAGGAMAYRYACLRPGAVSAIAPVSTAKHTADDSGAVGVALLHIHGAMDSNVPLEGNDTFPPVEDGITRWVEVNNTGAPPLPTDVTMGDGGKTRHRRWICDVTGKRGHPVVVDYYLVADGTHGWSFPGAGFGTTALIMEFFGAH